MASKKREEADRVATELDDVGQQLNDLAALSLAPGQEERLGQAKGLLSNYTEGFADLAKLTLDINATVQQMADSMAVLLNKLENILAVSTDVRAAVQAEATGDAAAAKTAALVFCGDCPGKPRPSACMAGGSQHCNSDVIS